MRKLVRSAALGVTLLLAACQTDGTTQIRTTSGKTLGPNLPIVVASEDAVMRVIGEDGWVVRREALRLADRYIELFHFAKGFVSYEELTASAYMASWDNGSVVRTVGQRFQEQSGIRLGQLALATATSRYGRLSYALAGNSEWRCFLFGQVFGNSARGRSGSLGDKELRGIRCVPGGGAEAAELEGDMLDFIRRIELRAGD
jgi:hypothetical protein